MRAATLALLLLALPRPAAAQLPPAVEAVRFEGVRALDARLLEGVIATREPPCRGSAFGVCLAGREPGARLDTAQVRRDAELVRAEYDAWGYPDATVATAVEPAGEAGVRVVFRVAEGEPLRVRSVRVVGLDPVPGGVPLPALPLRAGEPYALPRLEASQRIIAGALAERGYAFARVEASGDVSRAARAADVVLTVVPGRRAVFGTTEVRAERPLTERVVRERLAFRPGERFTPRALERTQERLYALPVVDTATAEFAPQGGSDSVVATRVTVSAGRVSAIRGGGTFSSGSCLEGEAWWSSRYFAGAPRVVTVAAGASNLLAAQLPGVCTGNDVEGGLADPDYFLRGELREPLGTRSWLVLEAEGSRRTAQRAYVRRGFRGRVGLARELAPGVDGMVAWAPDRSDYQGSAPYFCGVHGACGGARLEALAGTATLAPVQLEAGWTSPGARRVVPGPRTGPEWLAELAPAWLSTARLALAGGGGSTGSELDFARAEARATLTRFVGSRWEVAARARAGVLRGGGEPLPPSLRLYGGGPLGVRGVPANLLGPRVLLARTADSAALGCAPRAGGCEGARVDPERVRVRPTGGDALAEASLEARAWVSGAVQVAGFVDWGAVRGGAAEGAPAARTPTVSLVTPGIGVRLVRPLPLRVDLAYDPGPARRHPLLLRDEDGNGYLELGEVVLDPAGGAGGFTAFRRRLQLQLTGGASF